MAKEMWNVLIFGGMYLLFLLCFPQGKKSEALILNYISRTGHCLTKKLWDFRDGAIVTWHQYTGEVAGHPGKGATETFKAKFIAKHERLD